MASTTNNNVIVNQQPHWISYDLNRLTTLEQHDIVSKDCLYREYIELAKGIGLDCLLIFCGLPLAATALAVGQVAGLMTALAVLPLEFSCPPLFALLFAGSAFGSSGTFLYVTAPPLWNLLRTNAVAHYNYAQHLRNQQKLILNHSGMLKI